MPMSGADDKCFLLSRFVIVIFHGPVMLVTMKIVIVGANGMLGQDLRAMVQAKGWTAIGVDLPEVDITAAAQLHETLPQGDWIVNCAAFTRVDDAEKERDAAFAVNGEGVRHLAQVALARNTPILHISTDYVFDGRADRPYVEGDPVHPLNVYGASKLAGEKALRAEGGRGVIVRTQSLFGKNGPNFVKAIVRKLKETDAPLSVVHDQISAPTYTRHLADGLVRLMQVQPEGVVHLTAAGACSWYDFACRIVAEIRPGHPVLPIETAAMNRPALRPMRSVLSNERYQRLTGHSLPSWQEGLEAYFHEEDYFT
jgi:dTDP-4-dehydrorhamnose reductase